MQISFREFIVDPGQRRLFPPHREIPLAAKGFAAMIGTTINHYRILEKLSAGGMGVVYRAEDLILRRPVALKFLSPEIVADEERRARFQREARLAAAVNHPNTCTVHEVGQVDAIGSWMAAGEAVVPIGTPFIAMELVEGETLAAKLARSGRLPVREVLDLAVQAAAGLAEAHVHGVVHRDLKPQNVMVTPAGRVKILDFGLAKPFTSIHGTDAVISTGEMISADLGDGSSVVAGTVAYMSPEQALGRPVDPRSDVFAFGIVLYELVAGRRPFRGDTATTIVAKILEAEAEPLPSSANDVPPLLVRIVQRCLQKRPEDRYQRTHDLMADLDELQRRLSSRSAAFSAILHRPLSLSPGIAGLRRLTRYQLITLVLLLLVTSPLSYFLFVRMEHGGEAGALPASGTLLPDLQPTNHSLQPVSRARDQTTPAATPAPAASSKDAAVSRGSPGATGGMRVGQRTDLSPPSTRAPADNGRISAPAGVLVMSSNPRSSATIDGDLLGVTPTTVDIRAGSHEIVMSSSEGLHWRGRIQVVAGEKNHLHRELDAEGRLTITADTWAEITVDGGRPEQTPIQFAHIATGLHELRAFRDGYLPQTLELMIEEGNTTNVRLKLEKRP
jgi:serine/threonine protein kinase